MTETQTAFDGLTGAQGPAPSRTMRVHGPGTVVVEAAGSAGVFGATRVEWLGDGDRPGAPAELTVIGTAAFVQQFAEDGDCGGEYVALDIVCGDGMLVTADFDGGAVSFSDVLSVGVMDGPAIAAGEADDE